MGGVTLPEPLAAVREGLCSWKVIFESFLGPVEEASALEELSPPLDPRDHVVGRVEIWSEADEGLELGAVPLSAPLPCCGDVSGAVEVTSGWILVSSAPEELLSCAVFSVGEMDGERRGVVRPDLVSLEDCGGPDSLDGTCTAS